MPRRAGKAPRPRSPSAEGDEDGLPGPSDAGFGDDGPGSSLFLDGDAPPSGPMDKRTRVELNRAAQQRFRERRKVSKLGGLGRRGDVRKRRKKDERERERERETATRQTRAMT